MCSNFPHQPHSQMKDGTDQFMALTFLNSSVMVCAFKFPEQFSQQKL